MIFRNQSHRLFGLFQGLKEFVNEVNTLASLQHSSLCKLIGFHAREGSEHRMLVFERLFHGSLDRLLFGRSDGPSIDWNARTKIALCAAQGLTFLHEEGPFQVSTLLSAIRSLSCVAFFPVIQTCSFWCHLCILLRKFVVFHVETCPMIVILLNFLSPPTGNVPRIFNWKYTNRQGF